MDSVLFLNPASVGIRRSHGIMADWLNQSATASCSVRIRDALSPKVEVVFLAVHHFYLIVLLRLCRKRVVFVCHGLPNREHYKFWKFHLIRVLIRICEIMSSTNVYVSDRLRNNKKGYTFHNITNSIQCQSVKVDNSQCVFFGRISEHKGLEAIIKTAKNCPDVRFVFFGYIEKEVREKFSTALTESNICYHGAFSSYQELEDYNLQGSIFISLNMHEPFGMVYLEAIELGLIPIVPRLSGAAEVISGAPLIDEQSELMSIIRNLGGKIVMLSTTVNDDRVKLLDWILNE